MFERTSYATPKNQNTNAQKERPGEPLRLSCEIGLEGKRFVLRRFCGIGAVQQDQPRGAHVQADLWIAALIDPGARTQPI